MFGRRLIAEFEQDACASREQQQQCEEAGHQYCTTKKFEEENGKAEERESNPKEPKWRFFCCTYTRTTEGCCAKMLCLWLPRSFGFDLH